MGNFSISHYSKLAVSPRQVNIDYVLDLAEIPTLELKQKWNVTDARPERLQQLAIAQAKEWVQNLELTVDGKKVRPHFASATLTVAEGAGNMPVYRVAAKLTAAAAPGKKKI